MNFDIRKIQKRLFIVVIALVLVAMFYFVTMWFLKGTITITVPEGSSVSIHVANLKNDRVASSNKSGSQSFKLKKGTYSVVLTKGYDASKTTLELGYRQTASVNLELVPQQSAYVMSDVVSSSVGIIGDKPAYLNNVIGDIRDGTTGQRINPSGRVKSKQVIFADDGSRQLLIDSQGFAFVMRGSEAYAVFDEGGDDDATPAYTIDTYGQIISAAYDSTSKQFCVLSSKSRLGWINPENGDLRAVQTIKDDVANTIDCDGGVITYAELDKEFDAETNKTDKDSDIFISTSDKEVRKLNAGLLTSFQLFNSGKSLVYVDSGAVKLVDLGSKEVKTIFNTNNSTAPALKAIANQLFVFDKNELWQLSLDTLYANRFTTLSQLMGVSSGALLPNGGFILSITRGAGVGVYATTSSSQLNESQQVLAGKLPYRGVNFEVIYRFDGTQFVVVVTNTAPIPSSGNMEQYNLAQNEAIKYIGGLGLNPQLIRVEYK